MLIFNGTEYRNLEEQVLKNKEDIAKHYEIDRALANLGIKVVGQVELPSELPDPLTYQGEFGDTYAVGNPEEVAEGTGYYEYYVFTRPDENAGASTNHWLNVGRISIVGPQGPKGADGAKGATGERGSKVTASASYPTNDNRQGDVWINTSTMNGLTPGDVYSYDTMSSWVGTGWVYQGNIRGSQGAQGFQGPRGEQGPQGPQGPAGPQGDVGGFINIWGTLSNVNQLPLPSTLNNLTVAYLVEHTGGTDQANDHYDLYIQVGETPTTAVWTNAGPFNAATLVLQDGVGLNVWDSNTKLDKRTGITQRNQAYVKTTAGDNQMFDISVDPAANTLVRRKADSTIMVPETPTEASSAVSKSYVDGKFIPKVNSAGVLTSDASGNVTVETIATNEARPYSIVKRSANGIIYTGTPTEANHAATKAYVDSKAGLGIYEHEIRVFVGTDDYDEYEYVLKIYSTYAERVDFTWGSYDATDLLMELISATYYNSEVDDSWYETKHTVSELEFIEYEEWVDPETEEDEYLYTKLTFSYQDGNGWARGELKISKDNELLPGVTYTVTKL